MPNCKNCAAWSEAFGCVMPEEAGCVYVPVEDTPCLENRPRSDY